MGTIRCRYPPLPLAGSSLWCIFMMAVTQIITGVHKYFFNSMHPSYTAQKTPKCWTYWVEKNGLHGEACYPRKHRGILTIYLKLKHSCITTDQRTEMKIVSDGNWAGGKSVQSLFPSPSSFSEQENSSFLILMYVFIYILNLMWSIVQLQWNNPVRVFVERNRYGALICSVLGWNKCSKKSKSPDVTFTVSWTRKAYLEGERV